MWFVVRGRGLVTAGSVCCASSVLRPLTYLPPLVLAVHRLLIKPSPWKQA